jgi:hypothetical protein
VFGVTGGRSSSNQLRSQSTGVQAAGAPSTSSAPPPQQASADPTQGVANPTNPPAPIPTVTQAPTQPPVPAPTQADTPAGTILDAGQTWWQGGMGIRLAQPSLDVHGFAPVFTFYNRRPSSSPALFSFDIDSFSVVDDLGRQLKVDLCTDNGFCGDHPWSFSLPSGRSTDWGSTYSCCLVEVHGNLTDKTIHYLIFTASGISSITKAQWRIDVSNH